MIGQPGLANQKDAQAEIADLRRQIAEMTATALSGTPDAGFLHGLLATSDDCVKVLDLDGKLLFMSDHAKQAMEVEDFDRIRGCPWPDFWKDAGNEAAQAAVAAARAGGVGRFEGGALTMAGTPRWWDVQVSAILDADRRPASLLAVSRDITARKLADRRQVALLELGDRLRTMTNLEAMAMAAAEIVGLTLGVAGAGYGTMDADGVTCTVDRDWSAPGVASIAGRHQLDHYGRYWDRLQAGEIVVVDDVEVDPRTSTSSSQAAFDAIRARAFINLPLLERGRLVALFFVVSIEPRRWTAEEIGFVRNVTERARSAIERRRAEASLSELAASLERQVAERTADRNRLWQLSADIMLVAGFDGVIVAVNPAWTSGLGWSEAELLGRSLIDFVHPDDVVRTKAGAAALSDGLTLQQFENRYRCKHGGERWISWTAVPGDGLINAVGRDITASRQQAEALQQAEERLRQSLKMEAVGQLTGGLAHDFNNLLTVVDGSLELLGTRLSQGRLENLGRYIGAAQGASQRAAALTHRLLAFSRRQTLDPKSTDINRLVAGIQDLIGRTVGPAIAIEVAGADDLWRVRVDPNQLENALLNLCINARDAMPDGGRLVIETANSRLDAPEAAACELPPGDYTTLSVTDTGTGMPADVIAQVFDPFFTTKPIGQGTGLGLSMIYGFARQSGGQVRIESQVGHGTRMRLLLPRHCGAAEAEAPPARVDAVHRANAGETVLVVDDEPTVRMLVAEVLAELGYRVIEAADGPGGLVALRAAARVDLLVTDLGLPGPMNGRQMADAARVVYPTLKVLFITGYAESAAVRDGGLDRAMHVLTKPFTLQALAGRIRDLLGP